MTPTKRKPASNNGQKSVRFTAPETIKEILDKPTWRKQPVVNEQPIKKSARAAKGEAAIQFVVSKLLFVRLPTARRAELEERCSQLLRTEQLAAWWPMLSSSDQELTERSTQGSADSVAWDFCEAIDTVSERRGLQGVTDALVPLVVPVISSWETSGDIADVDNTNVEAATAAKGKKAGNALGDARGRCFREYSKRTVHYDMQRDNDLELKRSGRPTRFSYSCVPLQQGGPLEFRFHFMTTVRGEYEYDSIVLGVGVSSQTAVARELAAEQALANWETCDSFLQALKKPPEPRKRERRRGREKELGSTTAT